MMEFGIIPGMIIKTNYKTGPYRVLSVSGPCDCGEYIESLDNKECTSEPHYHMVLRDADDVKNKRECSYLGGYKQSGERFVSVWSNHEIFVVETPRGTQMQLL